MGWPTTPKAAPDGTGMKFHVQELEAFFELTMEVLLPHVEAILCELERRIPQEALSEAVSVAPQTIPYHASAKRSKSKTRSSISSSHIHNSHSRKREEPKPTPVTSLSEHAASNQLTDAALAYLENSHAENHRLKRAPGTFSQASAIKQSCSPHQIANINKSLSHISSETAFVCSAAANASFSSISSTNEVSPHTPQLIESDATTLSRPIPKSVQSTVHRPPELSSADGSVSVRRSTRYSFSFLNAAASSNSNEETTASVLSPCLPPLTANRGASASSCTTDATSERDSDAERLLGAAREGNIEDVLTALEAGADVNCRDASGKTALHLAAWKGHADIVALLLTNGADASNGGNPLTYTPLHVASFAGHAQCVAFLVDAGVQVDCKSKNGNTPLHIAAVNGHETVVQILVAAGASRTLKDNSGRTAFDLTDTVTIRELLLL